jgi:hypothetical protein
VSSDSRNDGTAAKDSVEARLAEQRRALDLRTRPMAAISEMDWDLPEDEDDEAAAPAPASAAVVSPAAPQIEDTAPPAEPAPAAPEPVEAPAPQPPEEVAPSAPQSEPTLPSPGGGTLLMSADALRQLAGGALSSTPPASEPSASTPAPTVAPQPQAPAEGPKPALTAPVPLPPTGTLRLSAAEIQRLMPSGAPSAVPEPASEAPVSTVHASAGGGHVEAAPVAGTPAPAPAPAPAEMPQAAPTSAPESAPAAYAPPAQPYGGSPQAPPPGPPAHIANELDGVVPPASEQGVQPSSGGVPRILFVLLFFVLIAVVAGGYFLVRTFLG